MGKEVEGKGKAREEGTEEGCVREGKEDPMNVGWLRVLRGPILKIS